MTKHVCVYTRRYTGKHKCIVKNCNSELDVILFAWSA
jgi:hypothetical protein